MEQCVGLATENGASNNKKANRILEQDQAVCSDHDIARAVLFGSGDAGKPSKNPDLKAFSKKASAQSASFSRSVIVNKVMQEAQLEVNPELKPHQTLRTATKNVTRWTGLQQMTYRNRVLKESICIALTGDMQGECDEEEADRRQDMLSSSGSESSEEVSDGDEQECANRIANNKYPLAHRCLTNEQFRHNDLFESVLDRAKEVTLLVQDAKQGWGEGLDIGLAFMAIKEMRDEAVADRLEVVSGHGASQSWKEISGGSLPRMFQIFRKTFAAELTKRFKLDTTPSSHVQLALQMNPSINVSVDGPLLIGKSAFYETMHACYRRALKRQALTQSTAAPVLDTAAPAPAPAANPSDAPIADAPTAGEPLLKKRRSLLGVLVAKQGLDVVAQGEGDSLLDTKVSAEVERFEQICLQILAKVHI